MILTDYPWYLVPLCAVLAGVYAGVLYFVGRVPQRGALRWLLAGLRFAAVFAIAVLLLAPMTRRSVTERQKPHVVLAQDVSGSVQGCTDSAFSLESLVPQLEQRYRLSYVPFGTDAATDIGEVMNRFRTDDVAAMIIASDGLHNRGASPVAVAEQMAYPIHCIGLGDTTRLCDAWLANLRCNRLAMAGSTVPVELTVNAALLKGTTSRLAIVDGSGKVLFEQRIDYTDSPFAVQVQAQLPAEGEGLRSYTARLAVAEGEAVAENNVLSFYVDVLDARRKVAIVANAPHPDLAALRAAIESNTGYEATVLLATDVERSRENPLRDCQLAVLHNLPSSSHPHVDYTADMPCLYVVGLQTDLARFNALRTGLEIVSKVSRADQVTATLQPSFSLFSLSQADADAIEAMPPLDAPFGQARMAGDVQTLFAARHGSVGTNQPLVAASVQGAQRRAFVWGEGLWRWRLADYAASGTHEHFDRMVTQLVTFAAMQQSRERLQVDAARSYLQGEPAEIKAVLYDENYEPTNQPELTLALRRVGEDGRVGEAIDYTFRRSGTGYALSLPALGEGVYRYRAAADGAATEGSFAVEALSLERQSTVADHNLLATIANLTGGRLLAPDEAGQVEELLSPLKPTLYTHDRYTEWLRLPLALVLVVLLLAAEWVLRKYHGEL